MGMLSEEERSELFKKIRYSSEEGLQELFNQLGEDKENPLLADSSRAKASEKQGIVEFHLKLRRNGGAIG